MNFWAWFQNGGVSAGEVRAEIWSLGAQSSGRPLERALDELRAPDLQPRRAQLLRACVRRLEHP